jgi:hypothetical protein
MKFLLFCILFQTFLVASEFKPEPFTSEQEILKKIPEYTKKMPIKKGYQGAKSWSVLLKYTAENKHTGLFHSILRYSPVKPQDRVEFIQDVFQILKLNPEFFVKEFDQYFEQNKLCMNWFFYSERTAIESLDFSQFKDVRLKSLAKNNGITKKIASKCFAILNQKVKNNQ